MERVFYELDKSPFFFKYNDFTFYFSSKFYKDKFEKEFKDYVKDETLKLNLRYKMITYADEMVLLSLYKQIEKRGFKVLYKGVSLNKDYFINCILDKEYNNLEV